LTAKMAPKMKRARRWVLLWAQDSVCPACGGYLDPTSHPLGPDFPTLDHVMPRAIKGGNGIENLLVKHRRCNETRGARPPTHRDFKAQMVTTRRLVERPKDWLEAKALVMDAHWRRVEKREERAA
jgi:5-methylcytosine-specific restriction endonuclease McrA